MHTRDDMAFKKYISVVRVLVLVLRLKESLRLYGWLLYLAGRGVN